MRIAINCRSFSKPSPTGIGRYAYNLVSSLLKIDRENQYWLYLRKRPFDFRRRVPAFRAPNVLPAVDYALGRTVKALTGADVYHAPSPEFLPELPCPVVVTVHDLIYKTYPQGHTPPTIAMAEEQMHQIVREATAIICCSHSTANDLKRFFAVEDERVRVIYQGVDRAVFYPMEGARREEARREMETRGVTGPFIFFVGTIEPRKNLDGLLRAFRILKEKRGYPGRLVVAGMRGWAIQGLEDRIRENGLTQDVIRLGYVTDRELCALYNLADVFAFPSFYEGFGFPILEAMACGAAVVASSSSSCGEIAGEAALTAAPEDAAGLAEHIARLIGDERLRADLRRKAVERAREFSFTKTALETLKVYRDVCHG